MASSNVMNYAFNQDSKFLESIQSIRTKDPECSKNKSFTCNYPQVVFQQQEAEVEHAKLTQRLTEKRDFQKRLTYASQIFEKNSFKELNHDELSMVEFATGKLSKFKHSKSQVSLKKFTPQQKKSGLLDLRVQGSQIW